MKSKTNTIPLLSLGAALLAVVVLAGCASSGGKETVRVTEEKGYIQLHHVQDTSQPMDLKKGDATAMVCGKCKTVQYYRLTSPSSHFLYPGGRPGSPGYWNWQQQRLAYQDWSRRHYCPGCKSTITTTGTWLNRKETV